MPDQIKSYFSCFFSIVAAAAILKMYDVNFYFKINSKKKTFFSYFENKIKFGQSKSRVYLT